MTTKLKPSLKPSLESSPPKARKTPPRKAPTPNSTPFHIRITDKALANLGHAAIDRRMTRSDLLIDAVNGYDMASLSYDLCKRYETNEEQTPINPTSYNLSEPVIAKLEDLAKRTHLSVNYLVNLIAESV